MLAGQSPDINIILVVMTCVVYKNTSLQYAQTHNLACMSNTIFMHCGACYAIDDYNYAHQSWLCCEGVCVYAVAACYGCFHHCCISSLS